MASRKLSALLAVTALADSDLLYIVQGAVPKKVTLAQFVGYLGATDLGYVTPDDLDAFEAEIAQNYYDRNEVDAIILGLNFDDRYAALSHNHDAFYQAKNPTLDLLADLSIQAGDAFKGIFVNSTEDGFVLATGVRKFIDVSATATGASQNLDLGEVVPEEQVLFFVNGLRQRAGVDYNVDGSGILNTTQPSGAYMVATFLTLRDAVPPTNTVPPQIVGTAQVGNTLAVNTVGTWTGNPTSYAIQWYRNNANDYTTPTAISGATGSAYGLQAADEDQYIFVGIIATNSPGGASAEVFSNIMGPVAEAPSSGMPDTNATLTSAPGDPPEFQFNFVGVNPGDYLNIERSPDGVKDGSGNYVTQSMYVEHQIREWEEAAGEITNAALVADGYSDPVGAWWMRFWYTRDNGGVGPKDELNGTVTVSSAKWAGSGSTGSADKSQYLQNDSPFYRIWTRVNIGATVLCRTTVPNANPKFYSEFTINDICATGGLRLGLSDNTPNLSGTTQLPGKTVSSVVYKGFSMTIAQGASTTSINVNNVTTAYALPAAQANGDMVGIRCDQTTNTIRVYYRPVSTGVWSQIGGDFVINATYDPGDNNWYFVGGGVRRLSDTDRDDITANFGASAFSRPLDSGYAYFA